MTPEAPASDRADPTPGERARHVPERTCVACRRKRPQGEFVRVTRDASGWAIRPGARAGRGAYVCADTPACWAEKRLRRAFGASAPALSTALAALASPDLPSPPSLTSGTDMTHSG